MTLSLTVLANEKVEDPSSQLSLLSSKPFDIDLITKQRNSSASVSILENPVKGTILRLNISGFEQTPIVSAVDIIGKVYQLKIDGQGDMRVDIQHLAPGTYHLRATDGNATAIARFVIMN